MPVPSKSKAKQRTSRGAVLTRLATVIVLGVLAAYFGGTVADHWQQRSGGQSTLAEQALRVPSYVLQLMEWKLQNFIHASGRPAPAREEIVILGIDAASMELKSAFDEDIAESKTLQLMKKGWPWSREVYAPMIDKLVQAGAKAVIIDLMFPGPSLTHPEGDAVMKAMLAKHPGKVVLAANYARSISGNEVVPSLTLPCDEIVPADAVPPQSIGFVNYWADDDGVVRHARFYRTMAEEIGRVADASEAPMPSLVAEALRATRQEKTLPSPGDGVLVHFGHPDNYEPLSLHEILVPDLWETNFKSGAVFKDKFVFIGPAAADLQDYHLTPMGRLLGVQVHAHVLAAALSGSFLQAMPGWWRWVLTPLAVGGGLLLVLLWGGRPLGTLFAFIMLTILGVVGCWCAFIFGQRVIEVVAPLLALNLFGITGLAFDHMLARRRMDALRGQLSRYFSPDHAEELLRDPEGFEAMTAGQRRTVVVLFSDVRGFTSMAEKRPADELVAQLNEYLDSMVQIAFGQRGMIDKFIGDAIMAIWGRMGGAQSAQSIIDDSMRAVTTALRMRAGMIELNERWKVEGQPTLAFGLGIHQGEAIVGDIGSISMPRMEFTVIGDSVNTAARLESATKQYGVDVLISDVVYERVKEHFLCRTADLAKPVGKTIAVPIYTVLGYAGDTPPAGLAAFEQGIAQYRAGDFEAAIQSLHEAAELGMDDKLTQVYLSRCAELTAQPPADWDGVYVMTKK